MLIPLQLGSEFKLDLSSKLYAVFKCSCGDSFIEWVDNVKFGGIASCQSYSGKTDKNSDEWLYRTHPLYNTWRGMRERCYNKHHISYNYYGGKGISVCKRWQKFSIFLSDMGDRPEGTTLDRIDGGKDYCRENCKWSTKREQMRNTKSNHSITIDGVTRTIAEWSEQENAVIKSIIYQRLVRGWSEEKAIFQPVKVYRPRKPKPG